MYKTEKDFREENKGMLCLKHKRNSIPLNKKSFIFRL